MSLDRLCLQLKYSHLLYFLKYKVSLLAFPLLSPGKCPSSLLAFRVSNSPFAYVENIPNRFNFRYLHKFNECSWHWLRAQSAQASAWRHPGWKEPDGPGTHGTGCQACRSGFSSHRSDQEDLRVVDWGQRPRFRCRNGHPLQYSCLENSMDRGEEPGGLQSMGSQGVRQNWSNLACTYCHFTTCVTSRRVMWLL